MLGTLKKQADADKHKEVHEQIKKVSKELADLQHYVLGERKQGIYRDPTTATAKLGQAAYQLRSPQVASGENKAMLVEQAKKAVAEAEQRLQSIESGSWQALKEQIDKAGLSLL